MQTESYADTTHIRICRIWVDGGEDPEISEGLHKGFPSEETADFIAGGH